MAPAAHADDPQVTFTTTTSTVEYGQYWGFPVGADYYFYYNAYTTGQYEVTSTGTPAGYQPDLSIYGSIYTTISGYLSATYETGPLNAGSYTFDISGHYTDASSNEVTVKTPTSAQLTITKAKLGVELRVLADPVNPEAAIVTAKFTGRFVDEYQPSFYPSAGLSPAGTWHITLTDSAGELVTEHNVERAAGDDVLATSFYWQDAEPGEQYSASAEFVPSGTSASNFTITPAQDFSFTAPTETRPVPTSTAPAVVDASLPEPTGFGLPLWSLVLAGVLALGLAALVTVLGVRLSRRSTTTTKEVPA